MRPRDVAYRRPRIGAVEELSRAGAVLRRLARFARSSAKFSMCAGVSLAFCAHVSLAQRAVTATRDSNGVVVVSNRSAERGQPIARTVWIVDAEFGASPGELQLGRATSVRSRPDGTIFAFDQQASAILVISRSGQLLRTFGRKGPGPGEFLGVTTEVLVGAGDTLLVPQLGLRRVDRFLPTGAHAGTIELPLSVTFAKDWTLDATGRFVFWYLAMSRDQLILRYAPRTSKLDTLAIAFPWRGGAQTIPAGFLPRPMPTWCQLTSGSVLVGRTDSEHVRLVRDGTVERVIELALEKRSVSHDDRNRLTELETARQQKAAGRVVMQPVIAPTWPLYARLLCGPDGTFWVEHFPEPRRVTVELLASGLDYDEAASGVWDCYDRDGRWVARAVLPNGVRPDQVGTREIHGIRTRDDGAQTIVRLRLAAR